MVTATKTKKAKRLVASNNGTTIQVISAEKLFVDSNGFQRVSENSPRAKRIAGKFNWDDVHTLLVSPRAAGRFSVVDGGHRLEAIKMKFPGLQEDGNPIGLRCEVLKPGKLKGGHYVKEAMAFLGAQDEQRAPNSNDAFKAMRYARDRAAVATFNIAKKNGISIRFKEAGERLTLGRNQTRHGGVMYWAYQLIGDKAYKFMVELLTQFVRDDDSGDLETKALQGGFIRGLANFLKTTDMTKKEIIAGVECCDSAATIMDRAHGKCKGVGFNRPKTVAQEIRVAILDGQRLARV